MLTNIINTPLFLDIIRTAGQTTFYRISSAVLIVMVLIGIYRMADVEKSRSGNRLGAVSMFLAVILTLWYYNIFTVWQLYIGLLIGASIGIWLSRKVDMIQMPQMVALLNGFGGLASMLAGILTLIGAGITVSNDVTNAVFSDVTGGLAVVVGGLTWTGSIIAAAKLHRIMDQKPKVYPGHQFWTILFLIVSLVSAVLFAFPPFNLPGTERLILILVALIAANLFGYFFAVRVGGADMPITISLLNSFSGVAGAIAGMAISDVLLVAVGGIVGASGLILTQIMCKSMNRKLMDILLGKTSGPAKPAAKASPAASVPAAKPAAPKAEETISKAPAETELSPAERVATKLKAAEKVIIVPGYGMALSQAQPLVKQLSDSLEREGKQVDFAIHPVAGRMPGHMNVLLAEVDIPYDKLHEMDDINDKFAETDLVLVVGANDVLNPAANTAEGTPIYGMPILNVGDAKHVIICNFDLKPGYAGVPNPLYDEAEKSHDHVELMLGDAKDSLTSIQDAYRNLGKTAAVGEDAEADLETPAGAKQKGPELAAKVLDDAEKIIIVPGYGMALSQAQPLVKQLSDQLEAAGKQVDFAIHPVAGRMPGHMNVLLAEVDIPYDKLHEMDNINDKFAETDVVLIIGANDVVNPAANTAEGTPIYGMPVLNVQDAKHLVFCNFDMKPGYAGVDNPLYEEAQDADDHVILLLGDAKDSLNKIQEANRIQEAAKKSGQASPETSSPNYEEHPAGAKAKGPKLAAELLNKSESVIIVPGYGMALSQAQPLVKQIMDTLERAGKQVDFAIHPVAGRMPGHMNVLLAEVDIPYDKLKEMSEINDKFTETDFVLIIGANDVVNPAANTAEGTPIYGMPVLDVQNAKHVVICNFDMKPGYAGVDNPLYEEAQDPDDHVILLLGDAKDSLNALLTEL